MLRQAGSYTNFFADALIAEADRDARVIGIHAAMGGGTGMNRFEQRFPDRTFDVGIAEQVWVLQSWLCLCRLTVSLQGFRCSGWLVARLPCSCCSPSCMFCNS